MRLKPVFSLLSFTFAGALLSSCTDLGATTDVPTSSNESAISTCGACDGATFTDYRKGDAGQFVWPKNVNRLNVVKLDGERDKYFFVWGVGNGAVQFLLRVPYADQQSLDKDLTEALNTQQVPGSGRGYGMQGGVIVWGPPIPPVGPGGFPPGYVQRILASVQSMNDVQDHLANVAPGLQGGY